MRVDNEVMTVIANSRIEGFVLFLPDQLERKLYLKVAKCLELMGGKWNRGAQGHVFEDEPDQSIETMLLTGTLEDTKKLFQFFPTPRELAERVCDLAHITTKSKVLEPSCGRGDLADVVMEHSPATLMGVELNPDMNRYLADKPYKTIVGDFLNLARHGELNGFDRIVMNPPFARQQDVEHILTAYSILEPGGVLVAICSPSPFFRTTSKAKEFQSWIENTNVSVEEVPKGVFKVSGTMIRTNIVVAEK